MIQSCYCQFRQDLLIHCLFGFALQNPLKGEEAHKQLASKSTETLDKMQQTKNSVIKEF
jgi:hypothetical protein